MHAPRLMFWIMILAALVGCSAEDATTPTLPPVAVSQQNLTATPLPLPPEANQPPADAVPLAQRSNATPSPDVPSPTPLNTPSLEEAMARLGGEESMIHYDLVGQPLGESPHAPLEVSPQAPPSGSGGGGNTALQQAAQGSCMLTPTSEIGANVRDYPRMMAAVGAAIEAQRAYTVIAVASNPDGVWYALSGGGWVSEVSVTVAGTTCTNLPNASNVEWRTFGHVDFASLEQYREVTTIPVHEYMLYYPMLIFKDGTLWRNDGYYDAFR